MQWDWSNSTETCSSDKTQKISSSMKPVVSTAAVDPLQISPAFSSQVFMFPNASQLSLHSLHPLTPDESRNHTGSHPKCLQLHKCETQATWDPPHPTGAQEPCLQPVWACSYLNRAGLVHQPTDPRVPTATVPTFGASLPICAPAFHWPDPHLWPPP